MENTRGRRKKEIGSNSPFATRLRELLEEREITQPVLAEAIGVSRQSVGQWKDGKTVPDILDLRKIAIFFGVSTDYLLCQTNVASSDNRVKDIHELTGLSEDAVNHLVKLKSVTDMLSDLKEETVELSADEIQDKLEKLGYSVTPDWALAIKKAPRDIVSPTHILNLLFEKDDVDDLLKRLMMQIANTDKLKNLREINAVEFYTWSMQKQMLELLERLILSIEKNPKG
ncbi:MAG: helix-turn-helix transcriptional regulator [Lachnospiraceae bacterium]|nr:helix-turn-helix transcriptional regulator [Ruminococcus sp.]MCM1275004.1 helix-turn-helix transcriptional regulator [Lachnospiraceae bacterium]